MRAKDKTVDEGNMLDDSGADHCEDFGNSAIPGLDSGPH